jgi:hypothetical protein
LPVQNDVAVEVQGIPRTADAAGFEEGFEGSTVCKYDKRHICSAGGRPGPAVLWQGRAPEPILSVLPVQNDVAAKVRGLVVEPCDFFEKKAPHKESRI